LANPVLIKQGAREAKGKRVEKKEGNRGGEG